MVQPYSRLVVADNSGAKVVQVIKNLGGSKKRYSNIGDIIVCSVKNALPNGQIKNHQVVKALVIRTRHGIRRKTGEVIKFSDNAAVIIRDDRTPYGTRIFGPVVRELFDLGYNKIISISQAVV
ncbi:50S ribosomal protein L14 [symbiont of Argiope bruennichi]|uniref:50S ribosomal protein L14 n=1 Tax=symbiont of Argiope bruennichi TaxID=2810479 RepID=UPI003DA46CE6